MADNKDKLFFNYKNPIKVELLNFDITHVPQDVRDISDKFTEITEKIKTALQSGEAIDIAALIPNGEQYREDIIALLTTAENTCKAIASIDWAGVEARLQRVVSDITTLVHGKHTLSWYIQRCEICIAHFLHLKAA